MFLDQKVLEDDCEVTETVESPIPPDDNDDEKASVGEAGMQEEGKQSGEEGG